MTPYTRVRYHLKEWEESGLRPQNKEELFNRRHAELRNAIERIFGILKRRFKILSKQAEFSIQTQINIVVVTTALYNFIASNERIEDLDAEDRREAELQRQQQSQSSRRATKTFETPEEEATPASLKQESETMKARRDELAQRMWDDYIVYLETRLNRPSNVTSNRRLNLS